MRSETSQSHQWKKQKDIVRRIALGKKAQLQNRSPLSNATTIGVRRHNQSMNETWVGGLEWQGSFVKYYTRSVVHGNRENFSVRSIW
jgi:hypothetical protein